MAIGTNTLRARLTLAAGAGCVVGLYLASAYSYLLFHSLAELFSIVVAGGIFIVAWNTRRFMNNNYLLFLGIAYLFVGALDLVHTLAYTGMGVFPGSGTNLATQLWIGARFVEAFSLLAAPVLLDRKLRYGPVVAAYAAVFAAVLLSIFRWGLFPDCFVEGAGLTPFKKGSEYVISAALVASGALLYRKRDRFDAGVLRLLIASIAATVASELAFTFYVSAYGFSNLVGHLLKILSFFLVYKAIVETGLARPYDLLFRDLARSREELLESHRELEDRVRARTAELARANETLRGEMAERIRAQERSYRAFRFQKVLRSILESSLEPISRTERLDRALQRVLSVFPASSDPGGGILLVEEEPAVLVVKSWKGRPDPSLAACETVRFGDCACGEAAEAMEIRLAPDCSRGRAGGRTADPRPAAGLCVPILSGGAAIGVLNVSADGGIEAGGETAEFLSAAAQTLGGVIAKERAEDGLVRSEVKFRTAVENFPSPVLVVGEHAGVLFTNARFKEVTGYGTEDLGSLDDFLGKLSGMDGAARARFLDAVKRGSETRTAVDHGTFTLTTAEEKERIWEIQTSSIGPWDGGGAIMLAGIDRTEVDALEKQLFQAQKMEAIGRLAGGIAHDMNNYLGAISGFCELVKMTHARDAGLARRMDVVIETVQKAASLVRQLLAFCRRQPMRPTVLDPNETVRGMEKMLKRIIGEDIVLETNLRGDLWTVKSDPSQLEQILLNLCVNSRDAMPEGGVLAIETDNVEMDGDYVKIHPIARAGRYVMVSVTDTGVGIPPEIRDKIFEPFFTTKEKGKGTGLGLSSVYGIVKQNEGYIWVYSEVGRGTTFKIYLPRSGEAVKAAPGKPAGMSVKEITGKKILFVEDNPEFRSSIQAILESQGYRVVSAGSGEEAFAALEKEGVDFDLLLTDVIMPGFGGKEVYDRIRRLNTRINVLFVSGYPDNVIARQGILLEGVNFLQKPFTMSELSGRIREILGGNAPVNGPPS